MHDELERFPTNVPLVRRCVPDNIDQVEEKVTQLHKVHWSEWAKAGGAISGVAAAVQAEYREMGSKALAWWKAKLEELRDPDANLPTDSQAIPWPVPSDHVTAPLTDEQRKLLDLMDHPSADRQGIWDGTPTDDLLNSLLECEASGKHKLFRPRDALHIYQVGDKPPKKLTLMEIGDAEAELAADDLVLLHITDATLQRGWDLAIVKRVYTESADSEENEKKLKLMDVYWVHPAGTGTPYPNNQTPWPAAWMNNELLKWRVKPDGRAAHFWIEKGLPVGDHVVWYTSMRKKHDPTKNKLGKLDKQQRSLLQAAIATVDAHNAQLGTMPDDDGGNQLRRTFSDDEGSDDTDKSSDESDIE